MDKCHRKFGMTGKQIDILNGASLVCTTSKKPLFKTKEKQTLHSVKYIIFNVENSTLLVSQCSTLLFACVLTILVSYNLAL